MRITKRSAARFIIATTIGSAIAISMTLVNEQFLDYFTYTLVSHLQLHLPRSIVLTQLSYLILGTAPIAFTGCAVAVAVYSHILKPAYPDECGCRKCGYILKGLSKPECPECGEVI